MAETITLNPTHLDIVANSNAVQQDAKQSVTDFYTTGTDKREEFEKLAKHSPEIVQQFAMFLMAMTAKNLSRRQQSKLSKILNQEIDDVGNDGDDQEKKRVQDLVTQRFRQLTDQYSAATRADQKQTYNALLLSALSNPYFVEQFAPTVDDIKKLLNKSPHDPQLEATIAINHSLYTELSESNGWDAYVQYKLTLYFDAKKSMAEYRQGGFYDRVFTQNMLFSPYEAYIVACDDDLWWQLNPWVYMWCMYILNLVTGTFFYDYWMANQVALEQKSFVFAARVKWNGKGEFREFLVQYAIEHSDVYDTGDGQANVNAELIIELANGDQLARLLNASNVHRDALVAAMKNRPFVQDRYIQAVVNNKTLAAEDLVLQFPEVQKNLTRVHLVQLLSSDELHVPAYAQLAIQNNPHILLQLIRTPEHSNDPVDRWVRSKLPLLVDVLDPYFDHMIVNLTPAVVYNYLLLAVNPNGAKARDPFIRNPNLLKSVITHLTLQNANIDVSIWPIVSGILTHQNTRNTLKENAGKNEAGLLQPDDLAAIAKIQPHIFKATVEGDLEFFQNLADKDLLGDAFMYQAFELGANFGLTLLSNEYTLEQMLDDLELRPFILHSSEGLQQVSPEQLLDSLNAADESQQEVFFRHPELILTLLSDPQQHANINQHGWQKMSYLAQDDVVKQQLAQLEMTAEVAVWMLISNEPVLHGIANAQLLQRLENKNNSLLTTVMSAQNFQQIFPVLADQLQQFLLSDQRVLGWIAKQGLSLSTEQYRVILELLLDGKVQYLLAEGNQQVDYFANLRFALFAQFNAMVHSDVEADIQLVVRVLTHNVLQLHFLPLLSADELTYLYQRGGDAAEIVFSEAMRNTNKNIYFEFILTNLNNLSDAHLTQVAVDDQLMQYIGSELSHDAVLRLLISERIVENLPFSCSFVKNNRVIIEEMMLIGSLGSFYKNINSATKNFPMPMSLGDFSKFEFVDQHQKHVGYQSEPFSRARRERPRAQRLPGQMLPYFSNMQMQCPESVVERLEQFNQRVQCVKNQFKSTGLVKMVKPKEVRKFVKSLSGNVRNPDDIITAYIISSKQNLWAKIKPKGLANDKVLAAARKLVEASPIFAARLGYNPIQKTVDLKSTHIFVTEFIQHPEYYWNRINERQEWRSDCISMLLDAAIKTPNMFEALCKLTLVDADKENSLSAMLLSDKTYRTMMLEWLVCATNLNRVFGNFKDDTSKALELIFWNAVYYKDEHILRVMHASDDINWLRFAQLKDQQGKYFSYVKEVLAKDAHLTSGQKLSLLLSGNPEVVSAVLAKIENDRNTLIDVMELDAEGQLSLHQLKPAILSALSIENADCFIGKTLMQCRIARDGDEDSQLALANSAVRSPALADELFRLVMTELKNNNTKVASFLAKLLAHHIPPIFFRNLNAELLKQLLALKHRELTHSLMSNSGVVQCLFDAKYEFTEFEWRALLDEILQVPGRYEKIFHCISPKQRVALSRFLSNRIAGLWGKFNQLQLANPNVDLSATAEMKELSSIFSLYQRNDFRMHVFPHITAGAWITIINLGGDSIAACVIDDLIEQRAHYRSSLHNVLLRCDEIASTKFFIQLFSYPRFCEAMLTKLTGNAQFIHQFGRFENFVSYVGSLDANTPIPYADRLPAAAITGLREFAEYPDYADETLPRANPVRGQVAQQFYRQRQQGNQQDSQQQSQLPNVADLYAAHDGLN